MTAKCLKLDIFLDYKTIVKNMALEVKNFVKKKKSVINIYMYEFQFTIIPPYPIAVFSFHIIDNTHIANINKYAGWCPRTWSAHQQRV